MSPDYDGFQDLFSTLLFSLNKSKQGRIRPQLNRGYLRCEH